MKSKPPMMYVYNEKERSWRLRCSWLNGMSYGLLIGGLIAYTPVPEPVKQWLPYMIAMGGFVSFIGSLACRLKMKAVTAIQD